MSLFFGKNTETIAWITTTHTSEELGDKSKRVASCEDAKREDFEGYPIYLDEDMNLVLERGQPSSEIDTPKLVGHAGRRVLKTVDH